MDGLELWLIACDILVLLKKSCLLWPVQTSQQYILWRKAFPSLMATKSRSWTGRPILKQQRPTPDRTMGSQVWPWPMRYGLALLKLSRWLKPREQHSSYQPSIRNYTISTQDHKIYELLGSSTTAWLPCRCMLLSSSTYSHVMIIRQSNGFLFSKFVFPFFAFLRLQSSNTLGLTSYPSWIWFNLWYSPIFDSGQEERSTYSPRYLLQIDIEVHIFRATYLR